MVGFREKVLIEKAARDAGFDILIGEDEASASFRSSLVPGELSIATGRDDNYFIAVPDAELHKELTSSYLPGRTDYAVVDGKILARGTLALQELAERIFQLSLSLPIQPLQSYRKQAAAAIESTEARRLVLQRIGQDIFRGALDRYWNGRCPITGVSDRALLRASHIKGWSECDSDEERLDVFNGILLAAHLDAAFDAALMTFDGDGNPKFSERLSTEARQMLESVVGGRRLHLSERHQVYLEHHRARFRRS